MQEKILYKRLLEFSMKYKDNPEYGRLENTKIWRTFSLESKAGLRFYETISDEELLQVLREYAGNLGRSPAQKEVFWVWRDYLKRRFGKWPYALLAAGLAKSAGKNGKTLEKKSMEEKEYEQLLRLVRERAKELCRIPHPKDMPEVRESLKKYVSTWNQVISDAQLTEEFFEENVVFLISDLEEEYKRELEEVRSLSEKLNRAPLKTEVDDEVRKKLVGRCKSWRNVLHQLGLKPAVRRNPFSSTYMDYRFTEEKRSHHSALGDCYYEVLSLSEQNQSDLEQIREWIEQNHRIPTRKEVPKEVRQSLQEVCGTWANVLYQIGYEKENLK